jgi:hypothetical protein
MSSSPTVPTSTTASSSSSGSPAERTRTALIACGAVAAAATEVIARRSWAVDVHPLPPLLHNRPHLIAEEVRRLAVELAGSYDAVAIGYADCGTYGALDEVCAQLRLQRLPGLHCYDVYAGPQRLEALLEEQPGTYLLTDFLVRSFERTVARELGLDRWPELRETYFAHYTRVVWLRQETGEELRGAAEAAASRIGLPLTVVETGHVRLELALEGLLAATPAPAPAPAAASSGAQAVEQLGAPGLGLRDLVEREDMEALDEGAGLGQGRGALLEEPLTGEATGGGEAGKGAAVLDQEAGRLPDADPGRHGHQLGALHRAGQPEQQGHGDAAAAHPPHPGADSVGIEGQVADHVSGVVPLVPHRLDGEVVGDRRVGLRVTGDADLLEGSPEGC